jgi:broad specificity phosphatase PhoE
MIVLSALLLAQLAQSAQVAYEPTTVVLVRHAEKLANESKDPGVSAQGAKRAEALAKYFAEKKLGAVIVSDTKRAEETADLTAKDHGLKLTVVPVAGGGEEHIKSVVGAIREVPPQHDSRRRPQQHVGADHRSARRAARARAVRRAVRADVRVAAPRRRASQALDEVLRRARPARRR